MGSVVFDIVKEFTADVFVCGTSSIFGKGATIAENIARFREILK